MREVYDWEVENLKQDIKYLEEDMGKANMFRWWIILANVFNSIAIIVLSVKTWQ